MFDKFGLVLPGQDDELTHNGAPTIEEAAAAIQVWSICNVQARNVDKDYRARLDLPTLQEAALAFALPLDLVREAVGWHPWMIIGSDHLGREVIEHDGA